ncbi:MAG: hypothetical protein BV458_10140 [Thermoplasmata archaeon M9B2D]|nr:MAG: hypothetical protein BV458_10140 [Thermoplasmata archaeon M9B2D]
MNSLENNICIELKHKSAMMEFVRFQLQSLEGNNLEDWKLTLEVVAISVACMLLIFVLFLIYLLKYEISDERISYPQEDKCIREIKQYKG